MRWFASYWVTVAICLAGAGIYWLSGRDVAHLDDWLDWLIPGGAPNWWTIPLLVAGCYALVRGVLHRVLAYTESAIEASPRSEGARGRRRAAIGGAALGAFGNATGWWLAPFAVTLGLASGLASVVRWNIMALSGRTPTGRDLFVHLLLALAVLYATMVTSAMLFPDRPQPLRHAPELPPDSILSIPELELAATRGRGHFFRRRNAARTPPTAGIPPPEPGETGEPA